MKFLMFVPAAILLYQLVFALAWRYLRRGSMKIKKVIKNISFYLALFFILLVNSGCHDPSEVISRQKHELIMDKC